MECVSELPEEDLKMIIRKLRDKLNTDASHREKKKTRVALHQCRAAHRINKENSQTTSIYRVAHKSGNKVFFSFLSYTSLFRSDIYSIYTW